MNTAATSYNWKRDWKTWALAVSVVFNLAFAGLTTARMTGFWKYGPPGPGMASRFIEHKLPEGDRAAFRALMGDGREQRMNELMGAMRDDRRAVRDALRAEPFDRERFVAATHGAREHFEALSREIEATMLDAVERLSPEGRAKLADFGRRGMMGRDGGMMGERRRGD